MHFLIFVVIINVRNVALTPAKIECGYKQCPPTREGALNVHLIPHSHMDAGWVKTFDEYYYGTRSAVSAAHVQLIYHSVLSELMHDTRRKFTFSETAYFWRWWKEQRATTRATFRGLVQAGRVQFAGGGWVQADEATADYLQIIDQLTWGLRKLNDTLGPCGTPKAAWQIDAYGHSREHASLLAQMGYDGLFLGRVDYKERETMMEEDRMEFMWRGSDVLGKMSDIMSHTLFNLYNAPDGFCFDFLCSDEPIANDPDSRVYNAEKRVNDFISQIEKQAKYYDHDNILVTMGGDFTYQSAANWFMNIDKIISYVNSHSANMSDINIFYSTPSCYLKAIYLHGKRDKALHTDKSDQLPYGSDASTYWTGFYTSRPGLKYFARQAHIFLQVVKQLAVISRMADFYELHLLRHATSLILHHDAITGTSQQHVANDFIRILSEAVDACTRKVSQLLSLLTPTWGGSRRAKNSQQFVVCHQLNISQCRFMESQESALLLVYNPLAAKAYHHVRLPAVAMHYSIRDHNDEEVEHQLVPLPTPILNMPGRSGASIQELYFEAENIPPLGYAAYFISSIRDPLEENAYAKKSSQPRLDPEQETIPYISNEYLKVAVDKTTGLLESVQHVDGSKVLVSQAFHSYCQPQQTMQSGAYAFRPRDQRPQLIAERAMYYTVRGPLVKEIRQRFNDWVSQIIRLYRGEEFVELEWVVGPVPVGSDLGKEVVSIFKTNVSNNGEFLTDSNARQMMKRSCWNHTATPPTKKPVPACYYPVTSRICIRSLNTSVELCVLTDRAQGGTSYDEGEIELMLHRRLLTEDGFGLEESLNEDSFGVGLIVKGKHRLFFGNRMQEVDEQSFSERASAAARKWALEPRLFLAPGEAVSRRKWQNVRNKRYSSLRVHGLPRHIHVLTLEPWKGGSVLLRLENTLEKGRTPIRSRRNTPEDTRAHITVDLRQVFLQMRLRRVRETTLAANQWLEDARQMDWATRYHDDGYEDTRGHITVDLRRVFLQMKLRRVRETTLAANQWLEDARQMDWATRYHDDGYKETEKRYVYNGGDDGILVEDQDYVEAGKPVESEENKEIVNSEEDSVFARAKLPRRRNPKKGMTKPKTARYDSSERRQKRSINITENLIAQHNHSSESHKVIKNSVNTLNVRERYEEIPKNKSIDEQNNHSNESRKLFDVNHNPHSWKANHSSKLNIKSNISKSKVLERRRKLEELRASKRISSDKIKSAKFLLDVRNENESCNNRKRLNKNKKYGYRNSPSNEEHTDYEANLDEEGITKSIYEMYYKARPRKSAFKPHWRDTGETTEHSRRIKKRRFENYDTTESCEHSSEGNRREMNRRRGRAKNVDMPFFMTDRSHVSSRRQRGYRDRDYVRRARESDKDTRVEKDRKSESKSDDQKYGRIIETNEEEYDDDDDAEEMDDDDSRRRKRATLREEDRHSGSAESDQSHQEYVITLRPTQIRTFVLWFEDKKGYTL